MATPALVTFKTLADNNTVVALTGNLDKIVVSAKAVEDYMTKMTEITGGTDVEFNNTFRQICKDRVFYAFEPAASAIERFVDDPFVPEVVECILLTDNRVAMNLKGNIVLLYPEENNKMWKTRDAAIDAAIADALKENSEYLDALTSKRRDLKDLLRKLNAEIDKHVEFKHMFGA